MATTLISSECGGVSGGVGGASVVGALVRALVVGESAASGLAGSASAARASVFHS